MNPLTGTRPPPTNRFDSRAGAFGVLYAGAQFEGAFVDLPWAFQSDPLAFQ